MRGSTAAGIALGVAVFLNVALFAFSKYMVAQERVWQALEADLSAAQKLGLEVSHRFLSYWWAITPAIFVVCLLLGAVLARRPSGR